MRILADECIPRRAFEKLRELRNPGATVVTEMRHLLDLFEMGSADDAWIASIADQQPGWLVLTADRAKRGRGHSPRLPTLLPQFGVTGVFMTGRLQQRTAFEKARAVMVVWPQLENAYDLKPGSRFRLTPNRYSYRMETWPL